MVLKRVSHYPYKGGTLKRVSRYPYKGGALKRVSRYPHKGGTLKSDGEEKSSPFFLFRGRAVTASSGISECADGKKLFREILRLKIIPPAVCIHR